MEYWQALLLGVVQGLTEFLPISSSTHLALVHRWLGLAEGPDTVYFNLLCHVGTACSALAVLRKEVAEVFSSLRAFAFMALALLPLLPAYILLKPVRIALQNQSGPFLLCTAVILFLASRSQRKEKEPRWRDALVIGAAQSCALIPGISRSGSTIAAARFLGWPWQKAARFSFVLAIPAVLGGSILETARQISAPASWGPSLIGLVSAFAIGLGSLRLVCWILERGTLRPFAWYCLALGLFLLTTGVWTKFCAISSSF